MPEHIQSSVVVGLLSALALTACASSAAPPAPVSAAPVAAAGQAAAQQQPQATKAAMTVEDKFAQNGEVKIHYLAAGPADAPLVVMIHGFPDYSGSWANLMPALADGYRVAAMDTRGYNLSDKPDGQENYAMPKLIGDVAAVLAAEGREKAVIVGHDWGAAIAWQFAFAMPDKLDKLIILSVPHPVTFAREMATNPQQQANSQYARNFQQEGSETRLTAEALAAWVRDPDMKAGYLEAFKRSSFAAMMNYYRMNYPRTAGPQAATQPSPQAPAPAPVNVPVLVIHGMKDPALLSSGHAGTWNHVAKDSTILMIPDAGHFVQHDAPELVNRTIRDWLDARK